MRQSSGFCIGASTIRRSVYWVVLCIGLCLLASCSFARLAAVRGDGLKWPCSALSLVVERDGKRIAVSEGMTFERGDVITTGSALSVEIEFQGAKALLYPNTKVRLGSIFTWFGEVFVSGWLQSETRYVSAKVEGTEYLIKVDQDQTVQLRVLHGAVSVTSRQHGNKTVAVKAQEQVTVSTAVRAAEVQPVQIPIDEYNQLLRKINSERQADTEPLIPMLIGLSPEMARETARQLGVALTQSSTANGGSGQEAQVLAQEPVAGERGGTVAIVVGPKPVVDPDPDGDGLVAAADRCPNEPEDKDGFQDDDGCPDADNDGDGIADSADACRDTPEDIDGDRDDDGCPDEEQGACVGAPAAPWASATGCDEVGPWADVDVKGVSVRMRFIPAGRFQMGSPSAERGRDTDEVQHEVVLTQGFWLGETEVTQALWHTLRETNPSRFIGSAQPVESVDWADTQSFLAQLNEAVAGLDARLPTEAEWEYAARAGSSDPRYGKLDEIAWHGGNSGGQTHSVKGLAANAWGLYDMLGNVWEWTSDFYGAYPQAAVTDPSGPAEGSSRVVRGGSWYSNARYVRAALRGRRDPEFRLSYLGFRLARGTGVPEPAER